MKVLNLLPLIAAAVFYVFNPRPALGKTFQLRVLTYNIQGIILKPLDRSRYQQIGRILAARRAQGNAPHIVAVQEAFHIRTHELLAQAGYPHDRFGPLDGTVKISAGIAIYSEFPILNTEVGVYRACAGIDCMARKGWMRSLIQIPGATTPLAIWNSHMQAGYDYGLADHQRAQVERLKQVAEVASAYTAATDLSSLFLGDLNFRFYSKEYQKFIAATDLQGTFSVCSMSSNCQMKNKANMDWTRSIDHQFYNQGAIQMRPLEIKRVFTREEGQKLSDHDGVEAVYELEY